MEAIADTVIVSLGAVAFNKLLNLCILQDDLRSIRSTVTAIKAVLLDAEERARKSERINNWLEKLKDVLLDAEDLLDAYSAGELAREVMTKDKWVKEVRIFFSKSNRIACAHKMGRKIKAIMKKLDDISSEKNQFQFTNISNNTSIESNEWRQTHSSVREHDFIGRDKEKTSLINILLDSDVKNDLSVIPILGIGGSGKTALAQQVYVDMAIQNHFELKMWVSVSDESEELNIKSLAQKIIGSTIDAEMEQVGQELIQKIEGRLFLLVLDNVWNEHREKWLNLEYLLRGGRKGSMIIVTTRSEEVAQIMGTHPPLRLKDLDLENSWKLFCRVAFWDGEEPIDPELVHIGKDIVKKCAGVPLAIITIGSLLFTKKVGVREWLSFRDIELEKIGSENNNVLSAVKLSYDHLPSHLKNCFELCSVFPKDYEIEKKNLIQLWIAEGLIEPSHQRMSMEDVGHEYFMFLLSRSLFEDVRLDEYGAVKSCRMHGLIHELARSITKGKYYIVTSEKIKEEDFDDRIRHVSSDLKDMWKFSTYNVKTNKVRTIMSPYGRCKIIPIRPCKTLFPKRLRVLDLNYMQIREIPRSIGELKHLRYLDLSDNFELEKLPQGISMLHNLQTLKLSGCEMLKELPRDIWKMVSLRHIELDGCDSLICMPRGLGSLSNLQTLTTFVLDKRRKICMPHGARISELRHLNSLRGRLIIENLKGQRSNTKEVESAPLLVDKQNLRELRLLWSYVPVRLNEYVEEDGHKDEIILDALEPPHTIQGLFIVDFGGKSFSKWIGSLTSLQVLRLSYCYALETLPESTGNLTLLRALIFIRCSALKSLPESIGSLTSLKVLILFGCCALESLPESMGNLASLRELRFSDCSALTSLPHSIGSLTSLQELQLHGCYALTSIPDSIGSLTSLQKLQLHGCSVLASLPESIGSLTSLQELQLCEFFALTSLPESIGNLTSLKMLQLSSPRALASLPNSIGNLKSLKQLELSDCHDLASLPESIGNLSSLEQLELFICPALASLPNSIGNLSSLQALRLCQCSAFTSLPYSIGNLSSLRVLDLKNCSNLGTLPGSMKSLTSLQYLTLEGCSTLEKRYGRKLKATDWSGIAHIPNVLFSMNKELVSSSSIQTKSRPWD